MKKTIFFLLCLMACNQKERATSIDVHSMSVYGHIPFRLSPRVFLTFGPGEVSSRSIAADDSISYILKLLDKMTPTDKFTSVDARALLIIRRATRVDTLVANFGGVEFRGKFYEPPVELYKIFWGQSFSGYELSGELPSDTRKRKLMEAKFKESIVINDFTDSLNSFKKGAKLPAFLMDTDFDLKIVQKYTNGDFSSLREEIFDGVDNSELLNEIIGNPFFKRQFLDVSKKRALIPSDSVSNYTLAQRKLAKLERRQ